MKATKFVAFNDVTEYYFLYRYPLYNFVLFYYLWKSIGLSAVTCQLSTNSLISWPVVYNNKAKSMISDNTVEFADKVSLEKYVRLNIIITLHWYSLRQLWYTCTYLILKGTKLFMFCCLFDIQKFDHLKLKVAFLSFNYS